MRSCVGESGMRVKLIEGRSDLGEMTAVLFMRSRHVRTSLAFMAVFFTVFCIYLIASGLSIHDSVQNQVNESLALHRWSEMLSATTSETDIAYENVEKPDEKNELEILDTFTDSDPTTSEEISTSTFIGKLISTSASNQVSTFSGSSTITITPTITGSSSTTFFDSSTTSGSSTTITTWNTNDTVEESATLNNDVEYTMEDNGIQERHYIITPKVVEENPPTYPRIGTSTTDNFQSENTSIFSTATEININMDIDIQKWPDAISSEIVEESPPTFPRGHSTPTDYFHNRYRKKFRHNANMTIMTTFETITTEYGKSYTYIKSNKMTEKNGSNITNKEKSQFVKYKKRKFGENYE